MRNNNFSEQLMIVANQNVKEKRYWTDKLSGRLSKSILPYDFNKISGKNEFNTYQIEMPTEIADRLLKISKGSNDALHMILMTGLFIFINKTTGNDDIIVGTPLYKVKNSKELINTFLPIRERIEQNDSFKQLLIKIKDIVKDADNNANYPIEILVEQLDIVNSNDFFPLFEIALLLEDIHDIKYLEGIDINLVFSFEFKENNKNLKILYNSSCYYYESIKRIADLFILVLKNVLFNVDNKLSTIEIITPEERQELIFEFNDTKTNYPLEKSIQHLFQEQVLINPDRIAVIYDDLFLTYSELSDRSSKLAQWLEKNEVKHQSVVGLMIQRSEYLIISILGILKAGAAYLPIDSEWPKERIEYMLSDTACTLVLFEDNLKDFVNDNEKFVNIRDVVLYQDQTNNYRVKGDGTDIAYIIYTSGTTGKPKGTLTTHANVVRVVSNTNYISLSNNDKILQLSNYVFDGSVFDIFGCILNGSCLVIVKKEKVFSIENLSSFIERESISVFFVTTALFNTLVDISLERLKYVRKILFGGERISITHSRKALQELGKDKLIHVYGPTETTVYASFHNINTVDPNRNNIPIGKPISNTTIYVLNQHMNLVPKGNQGELYIGGSGVSRGYLNNQELTKDKFIDNPFIKNEILYKTGDLGLMLNDGSIEFLDRIDNQLKIRGYRVELGEIESILLKHDNIKECIIVAHEEKDGKVLCAYIIIKNFENDSIQKIREYLLSVLPDYMVPTYFIQMNVFPLTSNGKVDRRALPIPEVKYGSEYSAPSNEIEEKLVMMWSDILNIPQEAISTTANFFEIGGHSLRATIFSNRLFEELNVELKLTDFFNAPTIKKITELIMPEIKLGKETDYDEVSISLQP